MELGKIQKVEYEYDQKRINQMLSEGWVILNTAGGQDEDGSPIITVLLGLPAQD